MEKRGNKQGERFAGVREIVSSFEFFIAGNAMHNDAVDVILLLTSSNQDVTNN